jgi:hypothetical protein
MRAELDDLSGILEAPLADIEEVGLLASNHVLRVEGWVPWSDMQIAEDHIGDVRRWRRLAG